MSDDDPLYEAFNLTTAATGEEVEAAIATLARLKEAAMVWCDVTALIVETGCQLRLERKPEQPIQVRWRAALVARGGRLRRDGAGATPTDAMAVLVGKERGKAEQERNTAPQPLVTPLPDASPHACPDDGTCHHRCPMDRRTENLAFPVGLPCWRVLNTGPLSGTYTTDDWPVETRRYHREAQR
ncbi:MAG TPA: hypothetical protein VGD39_12300 [Nocardioides sp.]